MVLVGKQRSGYDLLEMNGLAFFLFVNVLRCGE